MLTNAMINTINADVHAAEARTRRGAGRAPGDPRPAPAGPGQPRPASPRHRNQTDPPRHPHRRLQHHAIPGPCDPHRHRLHPRRRRSPHPDPHRTRRLRRHHPRPTTPCTSGSTRCPRHGTPPPSTNSATPSTTPTPSTPAPASPCATASNPTGDRAPITEPCQFSSSLRGRRGCGKIRSGRSPRSVLLGAAEAVCQFDPGSRVDGAAHCIATSTRVRLKPDTRSAPAGDLPMVKVVAVEGK